MIDPGDSILDTLVTDDTTGRPCVRRIRVRVTRGPDEGKTATLSRGILVVGKSPEVDFPLSDPRISRRHCELALLSDWVRVRDLGSKNGTFFGGARVETVILAAGARIDVGESEIALEPEDEPIELAHVSRLGTLETHSPAMRSLFSLLARAAKSDVTILIEGETGVGKELIARAIHEESKRASGPYVVFDCASVTSSLIASELFGHKKGAFTGAVSDRAGLFEAAAGGTIFIDEIGELPLDLQPALLRVLENRSVRRIGEATARPIDVRVLAATNRRLRTEVDAGRFRSDLYFRLAVVRVTVPPLRDRLDDLPVIARRILDDIGVRDPLHPTDLARLRAHTWPGNVRELRNLLLRSAALSRGHPFSLVDLEESAAQTPRPASQPGNAAANDLRARRSETEAQVLIDLLEKHHWNVSAAAREAGVDRKYFHRLMKRHGIQR